LLGHLPVSDADARLWHQLIEVARHGIDGLHSVVDEKDLPAALELAQHGLARQARRVGANMGDDGQAFLRRSVDRGDIAHAAQRHV